MLQQTWTIKVVISRTVSQLSTHGGARQWSIVDVLPTHLQWREVPVVTAGNTGAVRVGFLMAACAVQTGNAFTFRTTHDIRDVTPSLVALLWIISGGVTVDAARVSQH